MTRWSWTAAAIAALGLALWAIAPPNPVSAHITAQIAALPAAHSVWEALRASGGGALALCALARMIVLERIYVAPIIILAAIACFMGIIGTNLVIQSMLSAPLNAESVLTAPAALGPAVGVIAAYALFRRWWDTAPWLAVVWLTAQHLQMGPRFFLWAPWDWAQVGFFGAIGLCFLAHLFQASHAIRFHYRG